MTDRLFMLRPGFFDGARGPLYCGDSLGVEGLLSFFPALRDQIEVHYIDAPRPRAEIIALIGPDHQSAPVLVLSPGQTPPSDIPIKTAGMLHFIDDPEAIRLYLSHTYAAGLPA
ncbi:MAG: DUF3088 family protein [Acidocella sp.]|nr:DUF3088 family protein [Acidocella sp.]